MFTLGYDSGRCFHRWVDVSLEYKHEYTLEEFGLSKAWIQQELGPLLDHYGLPR